MITPDNAETDAAETSSDAQCVPLAALQVEGTAPAVGDEVEYTVRGKIARVDGECGYVTPATINGEPVTAPKKETAEPSDDDVMGAAMSADGGS